MAFRRQFRNFPRRFSGRSSKVVPRWAAANLDATVTQGTAQSLQILAASALGFGSSGVEQEATVIRLVGRLGVRVLGALAGSVGLGILKTANTGIVLGGFNDPLVFTELGTRDWMWFHNWDYPAGSAANSIYLDRDFDIRVKRNLQTEDFIRLSVTNLAGGSDINVTIDIRILIVIRA